ncbi:DNA methyltransferase [Clostridium sp. UBA7791]|uniref:DNA methyltransferase n=1 Tax=Clostridium sp. UBA7791 TaxID=1946379 RepID=UPI00321688D2
MSRGIDKQKEILSDIQEGIPLTYNYELSNLVHFQEAITQPVQRWYPYREGYSIDLVNYFINKLNVKGVIFDPFSGSGTTLLASRLNNLKSIGIDVNPISVKVAKSENELYTNDDLRIFSEFLESVKLLQRNDKEYDTKFELKDKVFNKEILNTLLQLKDFISKIENEKIRNLYFVQWLSIIEPVSNIKKEGNGIKYKNRKRTPNGYINIEKEVWEEENFPADKFNYVKNKFIDKLYLVKEDLEKYYGPCEFKPEIYYDSCLNMEQYIDEEIEFTFFSPPYCNCFDYFEIHKVELWLGDFINDKSEFREFRNKGLRSNTNSIKDKEINYFNDYLEKLINLFDVDNLWNKKIPYVVRGYFDDMFKLLKKIYDSTKKGGYVGIVVGNSAYSGVIVPTDLLLVKISETIGYKVEELIITRHLTTSSQQKAKLEELKEYLRESVIIIRKE